jgi:hypothetical protein
VLRARPGGAGPRGRVKGKKKKADTNRQNAHITPTFITFKIQIHNFPYQMKKSINHKVIIRLATTLLLFLSTKATYIDTHITTTKKNSQKPNGKAEFLYGFKSPV